MVSERQRETEADHYIEGDISNGKIEKGKEKIVGWSQTKHINIGGDLIKGKVLFATNCICIHWYTARLLTATWRYSCHQLHKCVNPHHDVTNILKLLNCLRLFTTHDGSLCRMRLVQM